MGFISKIANNESALIATTKGVYPASNGSNYRNATRTTIAPTGTISILANVSSGIEPVFSWAYKRKDTLGEHIIINPLFDEALWEATMEDQVIHDEVIAHVMEKGTVQDIVGLSKEFKALFKSALDISPMSHIKMQAAFQLYTDNAVSKTINLNESASKSEIRRVIIEAWKLGCKGLTIYRSGSRETEVLCLTKKEAPPKPSTIPMVNNVIEWLHTEGDFYESVTRACIYKVQSGCGKFYVIVGHDGSTPTMVFVEGDGTGGCQASMAALGRSLSAGLEAGTPPGAYVKQFSRVKCNTAMSNKKSVGKSCADIIGKCINNMINRLDCENGQDQPIVVPAASNKTPLEPKKGSSQCCDNPKFAMVEGCQVCLNCGASKCS
jgi:ribonucleoside-diphosphate reductase alpha chain